MASVVRAAVAILALAGVLQAGVPASALAQTSDPFEEINQRFQQRKQAAGDALQALHDQYRDKRAATEAQWQRKEEEIEARWQQMKREIEQKWDRAVRSTRKEWVDYSPGYDARSIVDFEKGVVEVAALVPVPKGQALKPGEAAAAAGEEIAKQFARVLSEQGQAGRPVMAGQVATKAGRPVGRQNAEAFLRKEVLPSVVVDGSPTESRDGLTRVKVTATVKMTPDHLKKRVQQYLDVVRANAKRQRLDPRLVLAVIHTESYFNPKAQSPVPAYGLMQLVPRAAARDAYNYLYQDDRVLDPEYLTDPVHNVELGAAYLRILMSQIFSEIPEGEKRNYLVICAYNWGPGNIRNKVVSRHRVRDLSEAQLFSLLTESTPEETRNYLKRVTERRALYEELVGR